VPYVVSQIGGLLVDTLSILNQVKNSINELYTCANSLIIKTNFTNVLSKNKGFTVLKEMSKILEWY